MVTKKNIQNIRSNISGDVGWYPNLDSCYGIFIAGLQAIEREHQFGSLKNIYSHALDLYEELTEEAGELGHINFTGMEGITFGQDHVHTDDASSLLIAQRYADVIERELKNRSGNNQNE